MKLLLKLSQCMLTLRFRVQMRVKMICGRGQKPPYQSERQSSDVNNSWIPSRQLCDGKKGGEGAARRRRGWSVAATNYNCQSGLGILPPRPKGLRFGQGESPLDVVGMDMLLDISAQWTTIGSGGHRCRQDCCFNWQMRSDFGGGGKGGGEEEELPPLSSLSRQLALSHLGPPPTSK